MLALWVCALLASLGSSSGLETEVETRGNPDMACAPQFFVSGIGRPVDGLYEMTDKWVNKRGIYQNRGVCLHWYAQSNQWWFSSCKYSGRNYGYGYVNDNVRCPYESQKYQKHNHEPVPGVHLDASVSTFVGEGIAHLNSATVHLTEEDTKYGIIKEDSMKHIQDHIIVASLYIQDAQENLEIEVLRNYKELKDTLHESGLVEARIKTLSLQLKKEQNLLKSSKRSMDTFKASLEDAKNNLLSAEERLADAQSRLLRKQAADRTLKRMCKSVGWLSFGVPCVAQGVAFVTDLIPARNQMQISNEHYYNSLKQWQRYEQDHNIISAKVRELEDSIKNLKPTLTALKIKMDNLKKKQSELGSLSLALKTSMQKLVEIGSAVRSMTIKDKNGVIKVSRMIKTMESGIQNTITRVKAAKTILNIDSGSIAKLEMSFQKLRMSILRLESKTQKLSEIPMVTARPRIPRFEDGLDF